MVLIIALCQISLCSKDENGILGSFTVGSHRFVVIALTYMTSPKIPLLPEYYNRSCTISTKMSITINIVRILHMKHAR